LGGGLDPDKDTLVLTLSDDPKDRHLVSIALGDKGDADGIDLLQSARGAVFVKLAPWVQVPKGALPPKQLVSVAVVPNTSVKLKLPEWARPELRKPGQGKSIME